MGLLLRSWSLTMRFALIWFFWLPHIIAQSVSRAPGRGLNELLQDYAYMAFDRPKTGIPYDGVVPSNLTGIKIAAMRLRSGSLRRRGVEMYKEFEIPIGVIATPYVERLVLVYQNLGNWSMVYYPLDGYTYLTPVLGLLAYDASNLSATNLPQLDIRASGDPILIRFQDVKSAPQGSIVKCVLFNTGSVNISNTVSGSTCSTSRQGHFAIVVEGSLPPSPVSPAPAPSGEGKKKSNSKVWIIVGPVVGGLALLALLSLMVICALKFKKRRRMHNMERASELGESLRMTSVGETKAPTATVTRTQPVLESEYVP